MNRFRRAVAFGLLLSVCACVPDVTIPETEARELASKALADYCKLEKLSPQYFKLSEISPDAGTQWMIVYASSGITPAQEVVVSISKKGRVEVHSMVEGRDEGPGRP